nr:GFA family protein [Sphingomicrobium nitratireducens]
MSEGYASARRCDCSYCAMRGAVALSVPLDGFELLSGDEVLATYIFNTGSAQHHFCSRCGIYTHHRRRSNPDQFGLNAATIDGVSPFDFPDVAVLNGREHPRDNPDSKPVVGTLSFRRAD